MAEVVEYIDDVKFKWNINHLKFIMIISKYLIYNEIYSLHLLSLLLVPRTESYHITNNYNFGFFE